MTSFVLIDRTSNETKTKTESGEACAALTIYARTPNPNPSPNPNDMSSQYGVCTGCGRLRYIPYGFIRFGSGGEAAGVKIPSKSPFDSLSVWFARARLVPRPRHRAASGRAWWVGHLFQESQEDDSTGFHLKAKFTTTRKFTNFRLS